MLFRQVRNLTAVIGAVGALAAMPAHAKPTADYAFLAANDAFRAGNPLKLSKHAERLRGHVLEPYTEYWLLALRLEDTPASEVSGFLARHAGTVYADLLRAEWLRVLGKRADRERFERELPPLVLDDLEIRCYAWDAHLARGDQFAAVEALQMWREPKELPAGCMMLEERLVAEGRVDTTAIWQRVRLLFQNGQITAAKRALGHLGREDAPNEHQLAQAVIRPDRLLRGSMAKINTRAQREVMVLAATRLARNDPGAAAEALEGALGEKLAAQDRQSLWGWTAYQAALRHLPEAGDWYARAGDAMMSDEQLAWKARAALRRGDWQTVREAIDPMTAEARRDPAWSYWYGRALAAQGNMEGARAYYTRIAGRTDFYALLAGEALGYVAAMPEKVSRASEDEVAAAAREPGIVRALELYRLEMRTEATREWMFTVRTMSDRQLLAAAEVARRAEIFDRAIGTANLTQVEHNFELRYLAPYREVFTEYSQRHGLDEAWVLGLVRQESRFINDARSSAGAQGLMQLMPATARWVARQVGFKEFHPRRVGEVPTNVRLGTGYMKLVLESLGHPVLASTAYNAGPKRARRWRDERPLEGAIYAETIPFSETREYVKKVMANTVFYAAILQNRVAPLTASLGSVPGHSREEPEMEEPR